MWLNINLGKIEYHLMVKKLKIFLYLLNIDIFLVS